MCVCISTQTHWHHSLAHLQALLGWIVSEPAAVAAACPSWLLCQLQQQQLCVLLCCDVLLCREGRARAGLRPAADVLCSSCNMRGHVCCSFCVVCVLSTSAMLCDLTWHTCRWLVAL